MATSARESCGAVRPGAPDATMPGRSAREADLELGRRAIAAWQPTPPRERDPVGLSLGGWL